MAIKSNQFIQDKFKNVTALSFTAYGNELIINFSGFEETDDSKEFLDFVFSKIGMHYSFSEGPPTIH